MNLCFLMGKVVSDVNFEFILNSSHISIAVWKIELMNQSIVTVKAYNERADVCYRYLKKGMMIYIEGYIDNKMEIVVEEMNLE